MNMVAWSWGEAGFGKYEVADGRWSPTTKEPEGILAPGFVDMHIHGGFGLDWMEQPDCLPELANELAKRGVEYFLPTTISYPQTEIERTVAGLIDHPMIPGFHLEGPFLSGDFPGAQPEQALLAPADRDSSWDTILQHPRLKIVSLAGELPGAIELTRELVARGVIVSQAHTNATFAEANAAIEAGASHFTHFYNAMRPFGHREPGVVGAGLLNPNTVCELIYDRIHVSEPAARVLATCKPTVNMVAISDASKAAGMPEGTHMKMWGHDVVVGEGDVRLTNGALAGSAVTLLDVFKNLAEDFGLEAAMQWTSVNPRRILKLPAAKRWVELSLDLELRAIHDFPS